MHLVLFGIVIPALVVHSKRALDQGASLPPFSQHVVSAVLQLTIFALVSLLVARAEGLELFPRALPRPGAWLAGAVLLGVAIAIMGPRWRRAVAEGRPILRLLSPRNGRERAFWVVASAAAGFSEELTWRGVQFALLAELTGQPWTAAGACAVMFAVAHAVQGWKATVAIVPFALAFQLLVLYTGSLYIAMLVHFVYDLVAGFSYGRLARELEALRSPGWPADAPAPARDPENQN
jgi:membrane protease YdiL (CAAX protease family)